jgi:hypothetical protein
MDNILLISIPKQDLNNPPAALGILSAICIENNFEPVILDLNQELVRELDSTDWDNLDKKSALGNNIPELELDLEEKIKTVFLTNLTNAITEKTKFIAVSVFTFESIISANILIKCLENFDIPIIVGGIGLESVINNEPYYKSIEKSVDHIVLGDGEISFDMILKNQTATKIVQFSNDRDLNNYPLPDYARFPKSNYSWNKVFITGSRGCVRKCTFCDVANYWPQFRYRDADLLIDEIKKHVLETGTTHFEFTDSLINGNITNFYKFNQKLAHLKATDSTFADVTYSGQFICRPEKQMPPEHYEVMHYAGCNQIIIGIESFSESVRNHMKKKFSNADIDYHLEQSAYWSIPNIFLMITGYPTETEEDHQENIKSLYKYQKYVYSNTIFMIGLGFTMHLLHNTPMMHMLEELDISILDDSSTNIFDWETPDNKLKTRILRRLELQEIAQKLGYKMPRSHSYLQFIEELSKKAY